VDVILIGGDTPLGTELQRLFVQWGRHRVEAIGMSASRFRSERHAKKAARRGKPEVVVDLRLASLLASGQPVESADTDRSHWLAKACERSGILYLLLSGDRVFSGALQRAHGETDTCDAEDELGLALIEAEARVREAAPSACILRSGPLFAVNGDNWFVHLLDELVSARQASFDDTAVFCPSSAADLARVVAAMLDQCSVGAEAAGDFHYCASDRTTLYGFAEVVLASAGQFLDLGDVQLLPDDAAPSGARILDCTRLRETFAIKQLPWRGQINEVVKTYFRERATATK
jgi:dTDP-4-dehydrorhamnose reductase